MAVTVQQLRTLLADPPTVGGTEIFPDSHYEQIIELEPNLYRAAAAGARSLAAAFAQRVEVTAGPVSIKNQQRFEHYNELAIRFDQRAREGGGGDSELGIAVLTGVDNSEIRRVRDDDSIYGSVFYRGVTDNPPKDSDTYRGRETE